MHPIMAQFGPFTIYSYGVMLAIAIVMCSIFMTKDAAKKGIAKETVYDLIFWCVLWGIIGARIFYILLYWSYFSANPIEIPMLQKGGLAWQGGFIGGSIAGVIFVRSRKLPLRVLIDLSAPYVALGQAIGRIGCFLNGCCYGKPVSWGPYFPNLDAHVHPTQLYETGMLFLIFCVLKMAQKHNHVPGRIFILYLCLAGLERFIVEFFRADHEWTWLGLSLFQFISIGLFITGLILLKVMRNDPPLHRR